MGFAFPALSVLDPRAPVVRPSSTLRDALARMLESGSVIAAVVEGDRYVGALTLAKIGKMIRIDA